MLARPPRRDARGLGRERETLVERAITLGRRDRDEPREELWGGAQASVTDALVITDSLRSLTLTVSA